MGNYIRIDYFEVMRQASQIKGHSFELNYQIYRLQMEKNALRRGWEGPAATAYFRKMDELIEKIRTTQKKMSETADLIRITAQKIRQADLEAEEHARQL